MTEPKHPTLCEGVELTQGEVEEVAAMFGVVSLPVGHIFQYKVDGVEQSYMKGRDGIVDITDMPNEERLKIYEANLD